MNLAQPTKMHDWRPIFWEPVQGTGERLMIGVVYQFDESYQSARLIRDDVLDNLYGQHASKQAKRLIDTALDMFVRCAEAAGLEGASSPILGMHPGQLRSTAARTISELLRTSALLYSSLSNLDRLDHLEEADAPLAEEVNKRFSTEVRDIVVAAKPELAPSFGSAGRLIDGGQPVKFGFLSPRLIAHFSVLNPVRQSASVRDARARLWEVNRAMALSSIQSGALITAVPRSDDATLGEKQRSLVEVNRREIEREADDANIRLVSVNTAHQAARKLLEMV